MGNVSSLSLTCVWDTRHIQLSLYEIAANSQEMASQVSSITVVLELDLKHCIPQILFSIRHSDYKQAYGQTSPDKCMASDFCNTLLQDLVDDIKEVAVHYVGYKPAPSRSQGGDRG